MRKWKSAHWQELWKVRSDLILVGSRVPFSFISGQSSGNVKSEWQILSKFKKPKLVLTKKIHVSFWLQHEQQLIWIHMVEIWNAAATKRQIISRSFKKLMRPNVEHSFAKKWLHWLSHGIKCQGCSNMNLATHQICLHCLLWPRLKSFRCELLCRHSTKRTSNDTSSEFQSSWLKCWFQI